MPEILQGEDIQKVGEKLDEKQTKPPKRYSEASLVKELEKRGIGRPSTYASIVGLVKSRGYVRIEKGRLVPGPTGEQLVDYLAAQHPWVIDYAMTANMEAYLDQVESRAAGVTWQAFVKDIHGRTGFLDPGAKKSGPAAPLSVKQLALIVKNAPTEVSEKALAGDVAAGRAYLDEFFKQIAADKKTKGKKK